MKTIIVTGASSGIGRATAELFLANGWTVGALARSGELLQELADRFGAIPLVADVTDPAQVRDAFADFISRAGRLDALFNNAGIFTAGATIDEIPLDDWYAAVDVNLNGMFLCARAAFAAMRAQDPQGGRIINNGSISAHVPRPHSVPYTTTKHAITGLTRSLSLDGRPFDIACGQIDIGNARTAIVEELERRQLEANPNAVLQPTMQVTEAASAVLYMAGLPLDTNVQFMTIMATKMPYIGRG